MLFVVILHRFFRPLSSPETCAHEWRPLCAGLGDSFLHHGVRIGSDLLEQPAVFRAQGKENRTRCVSTVPTTAPRLQGESQCSHPGSLS